MWKITLIGRGHFPLMVLAWFKAWPASTRDVVGISRSLAPGADAVDSDLRTPEDVRKDTCMFADGRHISLYRMSPLGTEEDDMLRSLGWSYHSQERVVDVDMELSKVAFNMMQKSLGLIRKDREIEKRDHSFLAGALGSTLNRLIDGEK